MQWTPTTCERLAATEIHMTAEEQAMHKAAEELGIAKESLEESETAMIATVREARSQHPNQDWPVAITNRIASHAEDLDRRRGVAREVEARKKKHQKEYERAKNHITEIIRELCTETTLYEGDSSPGDSWRSVLIADIADDKTSGALSGKGILTVGDIIDGLHSGSAIKLVRDQELAGHVLAVAVRSVAAYAEARKVEIDVTIDLKDLETAPPEPEPEDPNQNPLDFPKDGASGGKEPESPAPPEASQPDAKEPDAKPDAKEPAPAPAPKRTRGRADQPHAFVGPAGGTCALCGHDEGWNLHNLPRELVRGEKPEKAGAGA